MNKTTKNILIGVAVGGLVFGGSKLLKQKTSTSIILGLVSGTAFGVGNGMYGYLQFGEPK
jgi:hypothetical protein